MIYSYTAMPPIPTKAISPTSPSLFSYLRHFKHQYYLFPLCPIHQYSLFSPILCQYYLLSLFTRPPFLPVEQTLFPFLHPLIAQSVLPPSLIFAIFQPISVHLWFLPTSTLSILLLYQSAPHKYCSFILI